MEVHFWAATDPGQLREHNEDQFLVDENLRLFVVCDGMGGHAAGEVASAISVRTIHEVVHEHRALLGASELDREVPEVEDAVHALLSSAVHTACARVFDFASRDNGRRGMGTTCSVLLLLGEKGFVAHVGDSRIYLMRDSQVHQLTDDHSVLNEMMRQGNMAHDALAAIPNKDALTRAVGVRPSIEVDTFDFPVLSGDRFLLCSDGLSGYFESDQEIIELIQGDDLEETCQRCIRFANNSGGRDNITLVVAEIASLRSPNAWKELEPAVAALRGAELCQNLEEHDLWQFAQCSNMVVFDAGSIIMGDAQIHEEFFMVVDGTVALMRNEHPIAAIESGQWFGELAIFCEDYEPGFEAHALERTTLLAINRQAFIEVIERNASFARKFLRALSERLSQKLACVPYEYFVYPERWNDIPDMGSATAGASRESRSSSALHSSPVVLLDDVVEEVSPVRDDDTITLGGDGQGQTSSSRRAGKSRGTKHTRSSHESTPSSEPVKSSENTDKSPFDEDTRQIVITDTTEY